MFQTGLSSGFALSPAKKRFLLLLIVLLAAFFRFYQISTLPPGDGFDPAYYGLDALRILDGERPVYLATNFGREVMFSYFVAAAYAAVGPGTLGIHLASAFVAIVTIPAVYLAANELFQTEKPGLIAEYGGLMAALLTAVSFWHLAWSRYSVRAILIPLFVSLLCFFLLRALRTRRQYYFLLGGIVMGLSFYTYQLAQLFPGLVVLGAAYYYISRRSISKRDMASLLLLFGAAFIVALPLTAYVFQNPGVFNQRIATVFVLNETAEASEQIRVLGTKIWEVVQMYTMRGDADPLINIPERPSLDLFLAVAFVTGILIALWRWRRPHYLFLLSWLSLMSAPAFLADKAAMSKRALGALPATSILIALALLLPLDWLRRRAARKQHSSGRWLIALQLIIIGGGMLFTTGTTFRDYFVVWANDPYLNMHYNVGVAEIGKYIAALPETEAIYLSPTWLDHATLKLHANNRDGIRPYNGRHCFVYPEQTTSDTTYVIVPDDEKTSLPLLKNYFPQGDYAHEGYLDDGMLYYVAYRIPPSAGAQYEPEHLAGSNWNNEIALLGYDINTQQAQAGDVLTINLYHQSLADLPANYTLFLHLIGPVNPETGNPIWGQVDREPCFQSYPTSWWQPGEIMRDTFVLTVSPDAPPGEYTLATGFYQWPEFNRIPIVDATNEVTDEAVTLQKIIISPKQ